MAEIGTMTVNLATDPDQFRKSLAKTLRDTADRLDPPESESD